VLRKTAIQTPTSRGTEPAVSWTQTNTASSDASLSVTSFALAML
jgi:hypothetical protein